MTIPQSRPSLDLTTQGAKELKDQLKKLQQKRPDLVARLARARSFGDLSENSEYTSAKEELELLDRQIQELEAVLQMARIVKPAKDGRVGLGSTVTIKNKVKTITITLVSHWEADPVHKKISIDSPLGQALIGKQAGDQVLVETPAGTNQYKVIKVTKS